MIGIEVMEMKKVNGDGSLKAFADIKFGDSIVVKGFSVLQGKNGMFVAHPKKLSKDGRWFEVFTVLSERLKGEISDKVLEAFDEAANGNA